MKLIDVVELLLLSMLWGASFLFMRTAAPEFGPIALIEIRVLIGAVFLMPILLWKNGFRELIKNYKPIATVGILNTALPFCLLAYATLSFTAGFTSVLNATSPLWTALIAVVWLKDKLSIPTTLGMSVGFAGVVFMVWNKLFVVESGFILGLLAGIVAAFLYGVAAIYSKKNLVGVNSLATATGSLISASLFLLPLAYYYWPEQVISTHAWSAVIIMGIASTAIAYVLYFRLIARIGPSKAITVTYLVPVFGMLAGMLFLDEVISREMIIGCGLILFGTSLATGLIRPKPLVDKKGQVNKLERRA